jgi:hypothetical protein
MLIHPVETSRLARFSRFARPAALALALVATAALLPPAAAAGSPQPAAVPAGSAALAIPTTAADRAALRRTLERLYEVLPTHDGVLLRPRSERLGVRTIELAGEDISVNGNRLSVAVLREWLGAAQADPVIRLSQLDPASRRALFDLKPDPGAASAASAASAAPAPLPLPAVPAAPAVPTVAPPQTPPAQGTASDEDGETQGSDQADEAGDAGDASRAPARSDAHSHGGSGSIVRFAGSVTVAPGESPEQVTALAGSVTVDGEVSGDVTAVGGSCTINGRVDGSVTAVGGSVRLGPHAYVGGDITSVGGVIDRDPGAQVHGSVNEVSALNRGGHHGEPWIVSPFVGVGRLIETLTKILLLALLVCLVLLVARPTVERIALRVGAEPWQAGLTGFLSQLAFLPLLLVITILLALTVIGCALFLLYPFALIGLLLAGLVGYTAVAYRLGGWAEEQFGWRYSSPYVMAVTGVALIEFLPFVGRVIGLVGILHPLALAARFAGFLIAYLAWTIGFGAVVLDFLAAGGFRQWRRRPGAPAPLPMAPAYVPPMSPAPEPAPAPEPPPPPSQPPPPADPWETR